MFCHPQARIAFLIFLLTAEVNSHPVLFTDKDCTVQRTDCRKVTARKGSFRLL